MEKKKLTAAEKYAPEVVATGDGSHTLFIPSLGEHYHSFHSSVRESEHVYIHAGLEEARKVFGNDLNVFEIGFGTGLNALVTALAGAARQLQIRYHSIEKYPLSKETCEALNYCDFIEVPGCVEVFSSLHDAPWGAEINAGGLLLKKIDDDFFSFATQSEFYHLIYFDAFGFRAQEEFWTEAVFEKCLKMLRPGGILVTYASKGLVRRNMAAAGFQVDKLPGPPGKREMVRAVKPL